MPYLVLNLFIRKQESHKYPHINTHNPSLYKLSLLFPCFLIGFSFLLRGLLRLAETRKENPPSSSSVSYTVILVLREMEVHSPVIAKRVWNVLRITFFMMRKGLISKRKLIMDMNLMMKKGKLLRKSLGNLMSSHLHHHHSRSSVAARGAGFGLQEYEFSCSNSPDPVFSRVPKRRQYHFNFPCINYPQVIGEEDPHKAVVLVPKTPEYTFNFRFDASDYLSPRDRRSPIQSPFSVRISNYPSEDENEDAGNDQVDDQAEDFIRRFYEQLRLQSRMQLLEYQEV